MQPEPSKFPYSEVPTVGQKVPAAGEPNLPSQASIDTLPDEILMKIFEYVVGPHYPMSTSTWDVMGKVRGDLYRRMMQTIMLSQVCSRWRVLTGNTPTLWTHLDMNLEVRRADFCFPDLEGYTGLSKSLAITFSVGVEEGSPLYRTRHHSEFPSQAGFRNLLQVTTDPVQREIITQCQDLMEHEADEFTFIKKHIENIFLKLQPHLHRCQSLTIMTDTIWGLRLFLLHLVTCHLPRLESLNLHTDTDTFNRAAPEVELLLTPDHIPALTSLSLTGIPLPSINLNALSNVRSLELGAPYPRYTPPYTTLKDILMAPSRLIELSFGSYQAADWAPSDSIEDMTAWHSRVIFLPNLKYLEFTAQNCGIRDSSATQAIPSWFLLRMPALRSLRIAVGVSPIFHSTESSAQWCEFINHLCTPVQYCPNVDTRHIRPHHDVLLAQLEHLELSRLPCVGVSQVARFLACFVSLRSLTLDFGFRDAQDFLNCLLATHQAVDGEDGTLYDFSDPDAPLTISTFRLPFPLQTDEERPFFPLLERLTTSNADVELLKRIVLFRRARGFPLKSLYFDIESEADIAWFKGNADIAEQYDGIYPAWEQTLLD